MRGRHEAAALLADAVLRDEALRQDAAGAAPGQGVAVARAPPLRQVARAPAAAAAAARRGRGRRGVVCRGEQLSLQIRTRHYQTQRGSKGLKALTGKERKGMSD